MEGFLVTLLTLLDAVVRELTESTTFWTALAVAVLAILGYANWRKQS
jgi:hypothetical protein